jgi:5-methyltetrahydrofolate--homocysteine methyltransferase
VPFIEAEKEAAGLKDTTYGTIVMATVKGDVHDIGKNIVGVVLRCNNYRVIDLGVMVPAAKILETARAERAEVIGLSGLITPSLDEMAHVAREMERQGLEVPLLIGGATTSKKHTAVRIAPAYHGPVVHVLDASRGVGVVSALLSAEKRDGFVREVRREYDRIRLAHEGEDGAGRLLPLEEARRRRATPSWDGHRPARPKTLGVQAFEGYPLAELVPYIDWTPFFAAWELRGSYPAILEDDTVGREARSLFADAQALLKRVVADGSLRANAVMGLFPANAVGDDIEVYADERRRDVLAVLHGLRQQFEKAGRPSLCLADFVAPDASGVADYVGAFAVTAGIGADALAGSFEARHDDYSSILVKALADRLAEALAERLHERVRREFWGYAADEALGGADLLAERYVGIRPAPGYPSCPDHTEKRTLFQLLDAPRLAGIRLTESCAMQPAASVSGWYFAHPEARYFGLGRIGRDQVADYARRKGMTIAEVERWLAPNLAYEPEPVAPAAGSVAP